MGGGEFEVMLHRSDVKWKLLCNEDHHLVWLNVFKHFKLLRTMVGLQINYNLHIGRTERENKEKWKKMKREAHKLPWSKSRSIHKLEPTTLIGLDDQKALCYYSCAPSPSFPFFCLPFFLPTTTKWKFVRKLTTLAVQLRVYSRCVWSILFKQASVKIMSSTPF